MQQMLDCPTGGPGCVPDTARHQRWPGPGLGYIQKFIMHYEVLLLIAALPSPAPTTAGQRGRWRGGRPPRAGGGGAGTRRSGRAHADATHAEGRVGKRTAGGEDSRAPTPYLLPPANRARGRAPVRRRCGRDAGAAERASGWPVLPRAPGPARGLPVEGRRGAPGDDPLAAAWALPLCSRAGARTHGRTCGGGKESARKEGRGGRGAKRGFRV